MCLFSLLILSSCKSIKEIEFILGSETTMLVGDERELEIKDSKSFKDDIVYESSDKKIVDLEGSKAICKAVGNVTITAKYKSLSSTLNIRVIEKLQERELHLVVDTTTIGVNSELKLNVLLKEANKEEILTEGITYKILSGEASIENNILKATKAGQVVIEALAKDLKSNTITITVVDKQEIELRTNKYYIRSTEQIELKARIIGNHDTSEIVYYTPNEDLVKIEGNILTAKVPGEAKVYAKSGSLVSNEIIIKVVPNSAITPDEINISITNKEMKMGDVATLSYLVSGLDSRTDIEFKIVDGINNAYIIYNKVYCINDGAFSIVGEINGQKSNKLLINSDKLNVDPYIDVDSDAFYRNYSRASSYEDSFYRTKHYLMSGSLQAQDEKPTLAVDRPMENGKYLRNTDAYYSVDGNSYYVTNEKGEFVNVIFKNGGYITLEEVAAHVLAFGEIPANQTRGNSVKPSASPWGKYLRLNHNDFSGDIKRYPFEPALPDIRGIGGDTYYYEMDLGTTGTTCNPNYPIKEYNDGKSITRGAARFVYTRYDKNHDRIIDINERKLFYTYNHYNDFQEYLNYEGGWGEMFGNITGGGELSSRNPDKCKPTPYVDVIMKSFKSL